MPQPVLNANDTTLIDELRRRGQLASGGFLRVAPQPYAPATAGVGDPSVTDGGVDRPLSQVELAGDGAEVDPATIDPAIQDKVAKTGDDPNTWWWLLPLVGLPAALALYKRMGKTPPAGEGGLPATQDPLGPDRGTTAEFDTRTPGAPGAEDIVEGEFTDVPSQKLLGQMDPALPGPNSAVQGALAGPQRALPPPVAGALTDTNVSGAPNYLTATEIARRKANARRGGAPTIPSGPPIEVKDAFSDFSDEELAKAWASASELSKQRYLGNQSYREQVKKHGRGVRRAGAPTSPPPGVTEGPEDLIGHIARALRETGSLKSQRSALRSLVQ